MICPSCGIDNDKVVDTRTFDEGKGIRRRRECLSCKHRFSTIESIEGLRLRVIKKGGEREDFSRDKLLTGLSASCSKRPISNEDLIKIVNKVETALSLKRNFEITTTEIGEIVMESLKELDQVAYVRFASVYRNFKDVDSFKEEIESIIVDR